ncbi:alkaline phosphatase family protein [Rhodococcus sp. NPDC058514]|uniref:alkaline phosphatase family protein n=1 Tax=unclassified Rhodococcus (in: high G+C Gram-positive bacteria) TaxID=192944 RepID=UPI003650D9CE
MLLAPRYGQATLSDLVPSVLAHLGVAGETDRIGLDLSGISRACVLLIDGLGAELLAAHPESAPFLSSRLGPILTAGFPTTTATSLASLGTGLPSGEHGVVGYLIATAGQDRLMNPLKWRLHGEGPRVDLLKELVPEEFQPTPTAFERAAADGISVSRVAPPYQGGSGLTRAALRGGEFRPSFSLGDLVDASASALRLGSRSLVYAYHGELDLTGHARGPASTAWALELAQVDLMARQLAERLPSDGALIVTADHGMVEVRSPIDIDASPELRDGVHLIGGEPRARHVYTQVGAADEVRTAWQDRLGDEFAVLTRAEAIDNGWFGPTVTAAAEERIGDVIAISRGSSALIRTGAEPLQSILIGHHGSLTSAELHVPLLVFRG